MNNKKLRELAKQNEELNRIAQELQVSPEKLEQALGRMSRRELERVAIRLQENETR